MLELLKFRQEYLLWLLLAAALLILLFFACSRRLIVRNYHMASAKLKSSQRLLILSDLHSGRFGRNQSQLVQLAREVKPDYILFPGDTVDDHCPEEPAMQLLEELAKDFPCLLVTGNHEYRTHRLPGLRRQLRALGVDVLENQRRDLPGNLSVTGLEDPEGLGEDFSCRLARLGKELDSARFHILLTHRPEHFEEYIPYGFDLVLCGHTHGGQWRLPGVIEGLFATGQGFFPTYVGGSYEKQGCRMIVSRGLSKKHAWLPRVFNRPEAVVMQLVPKK